MGTGEEEPEPLRDLDHRLPFVSLPKGAPMWKEAGGGVEGELGGSLA